MFKNSKSTESKKPVTSRKKAPPSIISSDMDMLGNIISDGTVDVDGRIEGNIKAGQLTIRENGRITGDVHADVVHVYGQVKGLIKAKDVQLFASARVEGTIMHESLSIEDGAFVDGKFKRTDRMALEEARSNQSPRLTNQHRDDEDDEPALLDNLRLITNKED